MPALSAPLQTLLDGLQIDPGTVVFDLDSTLISTSARHLRIFQEYALQCGDRELWALAETLGLADFSWDVREPLWRIRPRLQHHDEPLLQFWIPRYFDGAYTCVDLPYPGAVELVSQVAATGSQVVYLTARPEPTMGEGTRSSLQAWDFPFDEGELLWMKPDLQTTDADFKARCLDELRHLPPVKATFENEPGHANLFLRSFPDAKHFLLDTCHSPGAPPLRSGIERIQGFL